MFNSPANQEPDLSELQAFPSFPSLTPSSFALASFFAQAKYRIESRSLVFLCSQNPTETLATKAKTEMTAFSISLLKE